MAILARRAWASLIPRTTRFVLRLATAIFLIALGQPVSAEGASVPMYEKTECWFPLYESEKSECGYLTVAENRAKPDGRRLQLAVVILRARLAIHYTDPIVVINGGPGGELALDQDGIKGWRKLISRIPAWHQRDVIFLEQRGTGKSKPNLDCKEIREFSMWVLQQAIGALEATHQFHAAMAGCHARLVSEGHDLASYTSAQMAGDLADLRQALGYDFWNLYGPSYGSRIALIVMRDHSEGLRSAILDSVVPVEYDWAGFASRRTIGAVKRALDDCGEYNGCPGGAKALEQLIRGYNENPVTVSQRPTGEDRTIDVVFDGGLVSEIMIDAIAQDPGSISSVFLVLLDKSPTSLEGLADYMIVKYSNGSNVSEGVFYSVLCNEEYAFTPPEELEKDSAAYWQWLSLPELADMPEANANLCNYWQAGSPSPVENEAVVSDIPTLLLAGEFDPLTPPDLAKSTRRNLQNSYGFEFMNAGHGVAISHYCARDAISAFLDRPAERPNAICLVAPKIVREF